MIKPRLYVDFNNADGQGRVRLNCRGTSDDLQRLNVVLHEGLAVQLYDDELEADGVVAFNHAENLWVAAIDWNQLSAGRQASKNGAAAGESAALPNFELPAFLPPTSPKQGA